MKIPYRDSQLINWEIQEMNKIIRFLKAWIIAVLAWITFLVAWIGWTFYRTRIYLP